MIHNVEYYFDVVQGLMSYAVIILLSLQCSARVRHCLRLLVRVVDWCLSLLVGWSAAGSFWEQAVQGGCRSAFTCHPSPSLTTFAFRSREVRRLLLDWTLMVAHHKSASRNLIFGTIFFLILISNCYCIGKNVWKFLVSTMKIVPVARILNFMRHRYNDDSVLS